MDYNTRFYGKFYFSRTLTPEEIDLLNKVSREIHSDDKEPSYNCPGNEYISFQIRWTSADRSVCPAQIGDYECSKYPSQKCNWVVSAVGSCLEWNNEMAFYNYQGWLMYLLAHFFEPWGVKVHGCVEWSGTYDYDKGMLVLSNSEVITVYPLRSSRA